MSPEEIRAMKPSTAHDALFVELCAQLSELNANLNKLVEKNLQQQAALLAPVRERPTLAK